MDLFSLIICLYLKGRVTTERREGERDLPPSSPLPKWSQQLELNQSEIRSQERILVFSVGPGTQAFVQFSTGTQMGCPYRPRLSLILHSSSLKDKS